MQQPEENKTETRIRAYEGQIRGFAQQAQMFEQKQPQVQKADKKSYYKELVEYYRSQRSTLTNVREEQLKVKEIINGLDPNYEVDNSYIISTSKLDELNRKEQEASAQLTKLESSKCRIF